MPLRVSVSGVRGVIGDGLDAVVAARWAAAFGAWLPPGPVVVGRDTRPSGPVILQAATAALCSTGHDVWDLGIATTPTTELEVQGSEAVGGVIITASHNPQSWNALKFLRSDGTFLTAGQNRELQGCYEDGGGHVAWDRLGRRMTREGADERHLAAILDLGWLDVHQVRAAGLHAVVDAVEGAGGAVVPALLEALGVRCTRLHCGLSGRFPHDPEPTPSHLQELAATVKRSGADLGCAVDPDGDRLALVDGHGRALSEELTLVLAVDFLLGREPGTVAVNLSTTRLIEEVAGRHGVQVLRAPVGEANVVEALLEAGGVIGGEGNGGVIYPALHPGRDALVGLAMLLQALAAGGCSLAELADALPALSMVKEKISGVNLPAGQDLASLAKKLGPGKIDTRDGLRWDGPAGWVHVRPSNTEPIVRAIAEAADEPAARRLIASIREAIGSGRAAQED